MAKLHLLIASLLLLSGIITAKSVHRSKRGAVACVCITINCSCRPSLYSQLLSQLNPSVQPLPSYPVGNQPNTCYENCLRSCTQTQQQCQILCQQSCGQSVGQYGPASSIPPYNEPLYFLPGTTQAPQYLPQNVPYSPSGGVVSSGAALEQPTVCVQICMPNCAAQCIQQQQRPIPVVEPAPLGPGPVVRPQPGPYTPPTPGPITNVPPYQQPYPQPTSVVPSNVGSTVCIEVCMPGCNTECLHQNLPSVPPYTSGPTYFPQPQYETPLPSTTPLPPYQSFTPTPNPQFLQTPSSGRCIEACMPSCTAQCIEQQRQQFPYISQSWPYLSGQQQSAQLQPPQSLQVTLPQSIQFSPECVNLCQNACLQQCSQQNVAISQCSAPCSSTCSQNCPPQQLVTSTPAYIPLQEPVPVVQSQPIAQPPQYLPTPCQPSTGGATKCSCPSGFEVCVSVYGSDQCCRKRK